LLLNDDTYLLNNVFIDISKTEEYSLSKYNKKGIYIGSTKDLDTKKLTYGGAKLTNKFLLKYEKILPCGEPQFCDLGNANIMYVSSEVVDKIGILHQKYQHGVADYDYTLTAMREKIPVLITPNFCGLCDNDNKNKYETFNNKPFKERIKYLYAPTGLAFNDNLLFMKRNFYYRLPFVFITGWLKVLFPKIYALR
jgi:GT2 family glycosyltransferase